jgi:hypothetical protein
MLKYFRNFCKLDISSAIDFERDILEVKISKLETNHNEFLVFDENQDFVKVKGKI